MGLLKGIGIVALGVVGLAASVVGHVVDHALDESGKSLEKARGYDDSELWGRVKDKNLKTKKRKIKALKERDGLLFVSFF